MKKVAVIYWSDTGNVEAIADKIYNGAKDAGADTIIKLVQDAKIEDVINSDAVAFGSPSMDNNQIEQDEMEPFIKEFKNLPNNKKPIILFGSYGWDNGEFLKKWKDTMTDYGFNVISQLAVKEAPTDAQLKEAYELGKILSR
ncbi:MAG: flavodoxin [Bacillota bacterium]|nr:flavodoxin [Bacillota bacterium]